VFIEQQKSHFRPFRVWLAIQANPRWQSGKCPNEYPIMEKRRYDGFWHLPKKISFGVFSQKMRSPIMKDGNRINQPCHADVVESVDTHA
jgi:hypothetical protein